MLSREVFFTRYIISSAWRMISMAVSSAVPIADSALMPDCEFGVVPGWGTTSEDRRALAQQTEVAQAILNHTSDDAEAARIWEDPTPAEEAAVMAEAWRLADADEDTLYWGGKQSRP